MRNTFNTRRGVRYHGGGVSIVTIVKGVLGLAAVVTFAFQYGLVREEHVGVLSSALPSSSVRGGASSTTVDNSKDTAPAPGKMNDACPQASHLVKPIVLDYKEIKNTDNGRLFDVKGFTELTYEQWMLGPAGSEHHILLHHLATKYSEQPTSTCPRRHLVDIGTRYVASSLAMASALPTHPKVFTFDIPTSMERVLAFRGKSEEQWQTAVKAQNMDITFHNLDLLAVSDDDFRKYMNTWMIMLDTFHEPYTVPFEREWIKRLVDAKFFKGILLLDDIHLNPEMEKWWTELKNNAVRDGYIVYDVTKVGHKSGTGILDFSGGLVTIIDNI